VPLQLEIPARARNGTLAAGAGDCEDYTIAKYVALGILPHQSDPSAVYTDSTRPAQIEAISKWGAPREKPFEYLKSIRQPALVVNGDNDVIIYSVNSRSCSGTSRMHS
jgi:hypothetical protein